MAGPTGGPIQGAQIYKQKPGGKIWTTINWTGSAGASDGLRANIEYDDCHAVAHETTFIFKVKNNPSSSTDKDHYSLKMGSHDSGCALYENPTSYGGGTPSFRVESPHPSYHGCSGGQKFNVPAMPINNTKVIGLKFVRWNITDGVHTEWYYDFVNAGAGPWIKDGVLDDTGGGVCSVRPIGGPPGNCIPGSPSGGLQDTLRLNGGDFDLVPWHGTGTGASMVEIEAGTLGGGTPPPPDPGGGTPPPNPNPDPGIIKFFLSGGHVGASNTNPNDSLGGPITTTQISPDTMDNVFDDVGHNISAEETNFRCIYIYNSGGNQVFSKVHAYLSETDNFMGLIAGLSNAPNTSEQIIDNENESPQGGFTQIYNVPTSAWFASDIKYARVALLGTADLGNPGHKFVAHANNIVWASARQMHQKIARILLIMARTGNPVGRFHVFLRHFPEDSTNIGEFGDPAGINAASLPLRDPNNPATRANYASIVLDADDAIQNHALEPNDRILVEFATGDDANYLRIATLSTVDETAPESAPVLDTWNELPMKEPGWTESGFNDSAGGITHYLMQFVGGLFIKTPTCFATSIGKPTTYDTGIVLPDIPPNSYVALWLARKVPKETPDSADTKVTVIVEGEYV